MKNFFVILCAALLAASCASDKKSYVIQGIVPDSTYNGQLVYLIDDENDAAIDSAVVANGKFTFTGVPDTSRFMHVGLERQLYANVILEGGKITVDLSDPTKLSGTPLNDELAKYMNEQNALGEQIGSEYEKIQETYKDDKATLRILLEEKNKEIQSLYNSLYEKYFYANKQNAIGKLLFLEWHYGLSPEKVDSIYAEMSESIKNHSDILRIMESNANKKQTAEGKPFVDFRIENGNPDGTPVSLSDYVGKGKYVLVDFWASWCGPCVREIPYIAEVYKKYKGKKFDVLSIAVWDKREASLQAAKKHQIVWSQIVDTQDIPTKLYGIDGIPQLILFAPDGTILARNLRGDALKAKMEEVMKGK